MNNNSFTGRVLCLAMVCEYRMLARAFRFPLLWICLTLPAAGLSEPYIDVSIGRDSLCTLDEAGNPMCSLADYATRLAVPDGIGTFSQISAGETHICGIRTEGSLSCWGDNYFGQQETPGSAYPFVQLDAGRNHTCAVDSDSAVFCWGLNDTGQSTPPSDDSGFTRVSAGALTTCGIRATGDVICWGTAAGALPPELGPAIDISVDNRRACALKTDGTVQCWGDLGGNLSGGPYDSLAVTDASICALDPVGQVFCALESSSLQDEFRARITDDTRLVRLESGDVGTCGLTADGSLLCWGTRLALPGTPGEAVPSPTNVQIFSYSDTTAEITWEPSSSVPVYITLGFTIYRNGELSAFTENGSSYIDDTLDPSTNFSFAVSHVLKDGRESEPSEAAYLYATAVEPAVENLRASIYSSSALELFWDARTSETFPRYSVKRNGTEVYSGDGRSYFDDQLSASTRYTYAVESFQPGDPSSPVTLAVTTFPPYPLPDKAPAPPSGLQGQAYSQSALELFWDRPASTPAVQYHEISRDHQVVATINGISYFDSGVRAGTTYMYEVVAIDTSGQRSESAVLVMKTP